MSDTIEVSTEVSEYQITVGEFTLTIRRRASGWSISGYYDAGVPFGGPTMPDLDAIESQEEATDLAVRYGRALNIHSRAVMEANRELQREVEAINASRRAAA